MIESERIRINNLLRDTSRKDFPSPIAETFRCHDCHCIKDIDQMYEVMRPVKGGMGHVKVCYRCLMKAKKIK